MTKTGIEIKGMKELQQKLKSLIKSIKEPKKFFGFASLVMFQDTMRHFQNEEEPKGKWKPLKERTLIRRRGGEGKILQDTGQLRNSIDVEFTNTKAEVGTNDIRANTHQKGRKIGKGKIPARPFIWYSKNAEDRILDNFMLHLKRGTT